MHEEGFYYSIIHESTVRFLHPQELGFQFSVICETSIYLLMICEPMIRARLIFFNSWAFLTEFFKTIINWGQKAYHQPIL